MTEEPWILCAFGLAKTKFGRSTSSSVQVPRAPRSAQCAHLAACSVVGPIRGWRALLAGCARNGAAVGEVLHFSTVNSAHHGRNHFFPWSLNHAQSCPCVLSCGGWRRRVLARVRTVIYSARERVARERYSAMSVSSLALVRSTVLRGAMCQIWFQKQSDEHVTRVVAITAGVRCRE